VSLVEDDGYELAAVAAVVGGLVVEVLHIPRVMDQAEKSILLGSSIGAISRL
jgi:hypothetical protein